MTTDIKIPQSWLDRAEKINKYALEYQELRKTQDKKTFTNNEGFTVGESGVSNFTLSSIASKLEYKLDYKFSLQLVIDLITKNYYRYEKFFGYYHPEFYRKYREEQIQSLNLEFANDQKTLQYLLSYTSNKTSPIKVKDDLEIFAEYIQTYDNLITPQKAIVPNTEEFNRILKLIDPKHKFDYSLYYFRDIFNRKILMSDHDYWYWVDEKAEQDCYKELGLISDTENDNKSA